MAPLTLEARSTTWWHNMAMAWGVLRTWGNWKDRWDNMVSIPCPTGAHLARRLPIQAVEGRHEIIVTCQQCGHSFAWPVPPK
jgi:hypothetical protein